MQLILVVGIGYAILYWFVEYRRCLLHKWDYGHRFGLLGFPFRRCKKCGRVQDFTSRGWVNDDSGQ